ncbi:MAG: BatA domain-containing protein [Bacteroidota bacterium]
MHFINPYILFALTAVLIPVAIHLFNFRKYRRVYFSNVSFLKELQQKTQKQSQLLHLLVLLTRILAISALVFAFAQPYIPSAKKTLPGQVSVISIFVDNSFSMEVAGSHGRLLDEAKSKAAEIAAAYKADDLFQLLTNDFEGRHQRLVTKEEFLEMLPEIRLSPAVRNLGEISLRQSDVMSLNHSPSKSAYIISDFQQSTLMSGLPEETEGIRFSLIPLRAAGARNLFIDTCWFDNPVIQLNRTSVLNVRITNSSDADLEKIPVKLMLNGRQRAIAALSIKAGGMSEVRLPFTNPKSGIMEGMVEISDYPVTYDDIYYFVFRVSDRIPVLAINSREENPYLNSVFKLDSVIAFSQIPSGKIDYSSFSDYRLIILNELRTVSSGAVQEFSRFVSQGGSLLILPAMDADLVSVNQLLAALGTDLIVGIDSAGSKVTVINTNHPVFSDVFEKSGLNPDNTDLPQVDGHFRLASGSRGTSETLIGLGNGDPMLITRINEGGKIYLSSIPVSDRSGNWPRHALFVPAMLNIAFQSENVLPMMFYSGLPGGINLGNLKPAEDNIFRISKADGSSGFIPEYRRHEGQSLVFINDQLKDAGIFRVISGKETVSLLAFNYNRNESDLSPASNEMLQKLAGKSGNIEIIESGPKPLNDIIAAKNSGKRLWKWFILTTLFCIIAEVLLLRFFGKRNSTVKA